MSEDQRPRLDAADPDSVAACLRRVLTDDAAAVHVMDGADRAAIASEMDGLTYKRARPQVGEGAKAVTQDFWLTREVPESGAIARARANAEALVNAALARMDPPPCPPVRFSEVVAQWYPPSTRGISPHRDPKTYTRLVGILIARGEGDYFITNDREGNGARPVEAPEGSLLLMRQPGFGAADRQPFHTLRTVHSERRIVTLRHDSRLDG